MVFLILYDKICMHITTTPFPPVQICLLSDMREMFIGGGGGMVRNEINPLSSESLNVDKRWLRRLPSNGID